MQNPDEERRERTRQDLTYIGELKKSDAFNLYFMRRMAQKRDELRDSVLRDVMTPDEREKKRQIYLFIEDGPMKWLKQDEASGRAELGA